MDHGLHLPLKAKTKASHSLAPLPEKRIIVLSLSLSLSVPVNTYTFFSKDLCLFLLSNLLLTPSHSFCSTRKAVVYVYGLFLSSLSDLMISRDGFNGGGRSPPIFGKSMELYVNFI